MEKRAYTKSFSSKYQKYMFYVILFIVLIIVAAYCAFSGFPFIDSLIITLITPLFLVILYAQYKITEQPKVNGFNAKRVSLVSAFLFGMLALQAAWPIFMPRISMEDVIQENGIFFGDRTGMSQYQMVREAIIKVKPPLIPLFPRTYPIAENLRLLNSYNSLSLQITNGGDGKSIRIELGPVTGWSFDEVTGKITYLSDAEFKIPIVVPARDENISEISEMPNSEQRELYPYNYLYQFRIENRNEYPIDVYNLSFLINNNTNAWNHLKKWADDGFCITPIYSKEGSGSSSTAKINGNRGYISEKTFNSSIALAAYYVNLQSGESKDLDIVFKEGVCYDTVENNSPSTRYLINGTVISSAKDIHKTFIILVKNINITRTYIIYADVGVPYQYNLANLPRAIPGDIIQVSLCRNAQDCITSKNITVDMTKGYDEVNFNI